MSLMRATFLIVILGIYGVGSGPDSRVQTRAHKASGNPGNWNFVISGDSRNCGNVVMPAIANAARQNHANFYWHLGDLRMIQTPDEDYLHEPEHRQETNNELILLAHYEQNAWTDFIQAQIVPFRDIPFFLGIGNHELIPPKTRDEFIEAFSPWLDQPVLRQQRIADNSADTDVKTYFHWKQDDVDFIYLDNASPDQFAPKQLQWFEEILRRDEINPEVKTIVAAMHESLPDSLAEQHSMGSSETGKRTGRQVYSDLAQAKATGRNVYILASHSHFYMEGSFNTEYLRDKGSVLPGWIIGTAGAYRYKLPADASEARKAVAATYGYLLGTVASTGEISFTFKQIDESDVPKEIVARYNAKFVHWCFNANRE
jgi:hypothetical protein